MSDTIYLYVKTHNKTGLKYLGKTKKDPFKYKGSGVFWKNHLKAHGNDVSTKILAECNTEEEIKKIGLYYSKLYNVVESKEWANLIEENGVGGVTSTCFKPGIIPANKGKKMPAISKSKKEYWEKWREQNPEYKEKWKINNYKKKDVSEWIRVDNTTRLNYTILECPHCDKTGNIGNMKRWHFNKCKEKI